MQVHVVSMHRFSNVALGTPADLHQVLAAARRDFPFPTNFIQKLLGHRIHPKTGVMLIKVRWIGWGREGDSEEIIHNLVDDDPHRIEECLT